MVEIIQKTKEIKIGILDDMTSDGSPNTACQKNLERELQSGNYEVVRKEIMPGVFKETIVLKPVETKPINQQ